MGAGGRRASSSARCMGGLSQKRFFSSFNRCFSRNAARTCSAHSSQYAYNATQQCLQPATSFDRCVGTERLRDPSPHTNPARHGDTTYTAQHLPQPKTIPLQAAAQPPAVARLISLAWDVHQPGRAGRGGRAGPEAHVVPPGLVRLPEPVVLEERDADDLVEQVVLAVHSSGRRRP